VYEPDCCHGFVQNAEFVRRVGAAFKIQGSIQRSDIDKDKILPEVPSPHCVTAEYYGETLIQSKPWGLDNVVTQSGKSPPEINLCWIMKCIVIDIGRYHFSSFNQTCHGFVVCSVQGVGVGVVFKIRWFNSKNNKVLPPLVHPQWTQDSHQIHWTCRTYRTWRTWKTWNIQRIQRVICQQIRLQQRLYQVMEATRSY